MSVNRYAPHIFVLPEDDADRNIAIGFHEGIGDSAQFYILAPAGGRDAVCDVFCRDYAQDMARFPQRYMVLIVDFDAMPADRVRDRVWERIGRDHESRVFVLGVATNPERLKDALDLSPARIGGRMAQACLADEGGLWAHDLLAHNVEELTRLRNAVAGFLFSV